MTKPTTWPPGFTPQPIEPARCPLRYMRSRQTALDRGVTGTVEKSVGADSAKARVALPKRGRGA